MSSLLRQLVGLALLGLVVSGAEAQTEPEAKPLPNPQLANGLASRPLLMEPVVQQELKLTDKQRQRIDQIESGAAMAIQPDPEMAGEDGFDFTAMMGNVEQTAREKQIALGKALNTTQRLRLLQLEWQREGWLALGRADVARRIKLTPPQTRKIQTIVGQMKQAQFKALMAPATQPALKPDSKVMRNLNPANGFQDTTGAFNAENGPMAFNPEFNQAQSKKSLAAFEKISGESAQEVDTTLSAEQKAAFLQLLGPTFNFGLLNGTDVGLPQPTAEPAPKVQKPTPKKATKKR